MDPRESSELENATLPRRCYSEPPLLGNRDRPSSTFTESTARSSTHSLRDTQGFQFPRQKLNTSSFRGGSVGRPSTFPLLPEISNSPKNLKMGFKLSNSDAQQDKFPSFKNIPFNTREKALNHRGFQERKFQIRSRYLTGIKEPTPPKHPPTRCNPLRKRVQEIADCGPANDTDGQRRVKNAEESPDEISERYLNSCQSSIRRLSVITEKSNYSRTLLFDLEEENGLQNTALPAVQKKFRRRRPVPVDNFDRNSTKLQEHLQITEKQFDPLESKAALLSNWFQTLQTE